MILLTNFADQVFCHMGEGVKWLTEYLSARFLFQGSGQITSSFMIYSRVNLCLAVSLFIE